MFQPSAPLQRGKKTKKSPLKFQEPSKFNISSSDFPDCLCGEKLVIWKENIPRNNLHPTLNLLNLILLVVSLYSKWKLPCKIF